MSTHFFVDVDHAGDTETRQSHTGILLLCKSAPIICFRKRHNSVDASVFGSEFTETKNTVEIIEALCYKLHMFGVLIDGSTNIFFENEAVCVNTTWPEFTLSKKHHRITYHRARELVTEGTVIVSKIHILTNLAELFTNTMPSP